MSDNNFSWFENYRRKRAAKRYARRRPPRLAKDYGRSEFLPKGADRTTAIRKLGLSPKFAAFAYGAYLPKDEFEGWVHAMPIPMSYVEARTRFLRHKPVKLRSRTGSPGPMRGGGWSGR